MGKPEPTSRLHKLVLAFIRVQASYGATDAEIERACQLTHQSASARRRELVLRGLVRDSGQRRRGAAGKRVTVWVAPLPEARGRRATS